MIIPRYATIRQDCGSAQHGTIRRHQGQKQEIKARLCMDQLNDRSVVEQQYATATNLQTRICGGSKYAKQHRVRPLG